MVSLIRTAGLLALLAVAATTAVAGPQPTGNRPGLIYYIAPDGKDDDADGSKERPFATIARVQRTIRQLKTNRKYPEGGIAVLIRGGTYAMAPGLAFDEYDSGEPGSPVTWRSYPNETPVFDGGWKVPSLAPVRDRSVLARLPSASARTRVRCCPVREAGYKHCEKPAVPDAESGKIKAPITDLYADNVRLEPACYPDDGRGLESLDSPGKWYLDSESGILYVWAPRNVKELVLSDFSETFLDIRGLHDVRFGGLTFQNGRFDAVLMRGCRNVRFSKNVIRNFGRNALTAVRSQGLTISGNEFSDFGFRGIYVSAGILPEDGMGSNVVRNNEVQSVGNRVTVAGESGGR